MCGLYYDQYKKVPQLAQLAAECTAWKSTSWPLAVSVIQACQDLATELAAFLKVVEGGSGNVSTLEAMKAPAAKIAADMHTFNVQLATFGTVNSGADSSPERKPYPGWHGLAEFEDLEPSSNAVEEAALALVVGWGEVESDIVEGIKAMQGAGQGFEVLGDCLLV